MTEDVLERLSFLLKLDRMLLMMILKSEIFRNTYNYLAIFNIDQIYLTILL